jgi:hypothetical protein
MFYVHEVVFQEDGVLSIGQEGLNCVHLISRTAKAFLHNPVRPFPYLFPHYVLIVEYRLELVARGGDLALGVGQLLVQEVVRETGALLSHAVLLQPGLDLEGGSSDNGGGFQTFADVGDTVAAFLQFVGLHLSENQ